MFCCFIEAIFIFIFEGADLKDAVQNILTHILYIMLLAMLYILLALLLVLNIYIVLFITCPSYTAVF